DARDDVDFEAYIIRITDEDGDVVDEGGDVATVESSYGTTGADAAEALNKLFITDLETSPTFTDDGTVLNLGDDDAVGGTGALQTRIPVML
ncbi:MAG: hypothetical protein J4G06_04485, partial [Caldilineaceae bacterium]|nr:hypothetical protein [Caldilineaceae bacterium]